MLAEICRHVYISLFVIALKKSIFRRIPLPPPLLPLRFDWVNKYQPGPGTEAPAAAPPPVPHGRRGSPRVPRGARQRRSSASARGQGREGERQGQGKGEREGLVLAQCSILIEACDARNSVGRRLPSNPIKTCVSLTACQSRRFRFKHF